MIMQINLFLTNDNADKSILANDNADKSILAKTI